LPIPGIWDVIARVKRELARQVHHEVEHLAQAGLDWFAFAARAGELVRRAVPFERTCWHPVDPGTYLFTGSLGHNMVCSGAWLAEHEYVLDDVNKWHELACGAHAASLSETTQGELSRSARVRSSIDYGLAVGDELRVAFVVNGTYWGAAGFIRDATSPFFDADEVRLFASLSSTIGDGFRRALLVAPSEMTAHPDGPGMLVLDERGRVAWISPGTEELIAQIVEDPAAAGPHESRIVQAVAARARRLRDAGSAHEPPARTRVRTRTGHWLQLYGTPLSGERVDHVAVIIQPAGSHDIAPLVARAYGLTDQERRITRACLEGLSTREIAQALDITEYTVQDHLKSIFRKTGTRSRGELVGQVFLEHYVTRFEDVGDVAGGWTAQTIPSKP
jgi:DNA-binding CsgD family transcriptional regulator